MKKYLFVLLALLVLAGPALADNTNFSGVKIDGDATGNAATTVIFTVTDTSGNNTLTTDGAGDVAFIESGGDRDDPDLSAAGYSQFTGSTAGIDATSADLLMLPVGVSSDLVSCSATYEGAIHVVTNAPNGNPGACTSTTAAGTTVLICYCDGQGWRSIGTSEDLVG